MPTDFQASVGLHIFSLQICSRLWLAYMLWVLVCIYVLCYGGAKFVLLVEGNMFSTRSSANLAIFLMTCGDDENIRRCYVLLMVICMCSLIFSE